MDSTSGLAARIAQEQDDLLATIQLVHENHQLLEHLFDSLVDRLVAGMFVDIRARHASGDIDDTELAQELLELTAQCRSVGLTPPL